MSLDDSLKVLEKVTQKYGRRFLCYGNPDERCRLGRRFQHGAEPCVTCIERYATEK